MEEARKARRLLRRHFHHLAGTVHISLPLQVVQLCGEPVAMAPEKALFFASSCRATLSAACRPGGGRGRCRIACAEGTFTFGLNGGVAASAPLSVRGVAAVAAAYASALAGSEPPGFDAVLLTPVGTSACLPALLLAAALLIEQLWACELPTRARAERCMAIEADMMGAISSEARYEALLAAEEGKVVMVDGKETHWVDWPAEDASDSSAPDILFIPAPPAAALCRKRIVAALQQQAALLTALQRQWPAVRDIHQLSRAAQAEFAGSAEEIALLRRLLASTSCAEEAFHALHDCDWPRLLATLRGRAEAEAEEQRWLPAQLLASLRQLKQTADTHRLRTLATVPQLAPGGSGVLLLLPPGAAARALPVLPASARSVRPSGAVAVLTARRPMRRGKRTRRRVLRLLAGMAVMASCVAVQSRRRLLARPRPERKWVKVMVEE